MDKPVVPYNDNTHGAFTTIVDIAERMLQEAEQKVSSFVAENYKDCSVKPLDLASAKIVKSSNAELLIYFDFAQSQVVAIPYRTESVELKTA